MGERLFVVLPQMPGQKPAIEAHCFGDCGKIVVGAIELDDLMGLIGLPCWEEACPYQAYISEESPGTLPETHTKVFLRKLREDVL